MDAFISSVVILLLVLDPFGNVAALITILPDVLPERRTIFIIRESFVATSLLFLFMFFGQAFLSLTHLTENALQISGGILLFIIAVELSFPQSGRADPTSESGIRREEPFIFPVAIPLLAGPSSLATVMLISNQNPGIHNAVALLTAMLITTLILLSSDWIYKKIGRPIMNAIVRLMGLLLSAISVQMILVGIRGFIHSL